jgi:hypothetical protein
MYSQEEGACGVYCYYLTELFFVQWASNFVRKFPAVLWCHVLITMFTRTVLSHQCQSCTHTLTCLWNPFYCSWVICAFFYVHRTVHCNIFPIIKPNRCTSASNLFVLERHSTCLGQYFCPWQEFKTTYSNRHLSNRYCCLLGLWRPLNQPCISSLQLFQFKSFYTVLISLCQRCTNPGRQALMEAKFCSVARNICGSSVWNLL